MFALAMVRFLEERLSEAIRLLEQAIAINPTYEDAHDLLGRILLEIGPLEKATHHLRLALGLDATLLSARWDLMRAYGFQQQWERLEDLCILPVSEPMDVAVRAIVASRLLLWHPTPKPFAVLPEMEAPFITPSVLRYQRVVAQGELSEQEHQESLRLVEEANSPRLKTLLLQFMAEQLAFSQKWDACMDAIQESIHRELWDRIWLQHCPLFQPLQGNTRFQSLQKSVEGKLAPRLTTH